MPTKIEWCHETWNPITGCSPISEGCKNCYAQRMAQRLKGRFGYPEDEPFRVTFHPDRLDQPLKWKKPQMIFVCSMGDLFHKDLRRNTGFGTSWERVCEIYEVMMKTSWHTFLILTKRPDNMGWFYKEWVNCLVEVRNIWLGVTVESSKYLSRIDELLKIPAVIRFVSIEPMLEPMYILKYLKQPKTLDGRERSLLNWVIAGPETGPGKRTCKPEWIKHLYDQCQEAGVPFFDKTKKNWLAREFPNRKEYKNEIPD